MRTIARLYDTYGDAVAVVQELEAANLPNRQIGLVANANARGRDTTADTTEESHADTGAATGAGIGAAVGGGVGLLAGLGMLAIPGIGPLVAAGWLVSTLAGAVAGGAAGGLIGALTGAGINKEEAEVYEEGVRRGGSLVIVRTEDDSDVAAIEDIMSRRPFRNWQDHRAHLVESGWTPSRA